MKPDIFQAQYFQGENRIVHSRGDDLYQFKAFLGRQELQIEAGDGAFYLSPDLKSAHYLRGAGSVHSEHFAVVIRGFAGPNRTVSVQEGTYLPYVNGCSTRQMIPPERPGDPTFQMLYLPPHSSEQAHHIHSTVRVVYVLSGLGTSVVGMEGRIQRTTLKPGMVCILDRMCPHHFETAEQPLIVLPVHIWSSIAGAEYNHPMFNGTFLMNQG